MHKLAAPSGTDFESGFFSLALPKLQDKLPTLMNYLVGFEVVKKSEDSRKAVGVFGFKSNSGQILFVPAFFQDGSVKNLDTLYSKDYEQFYPLTEDWANVFLGDGAGHVGEKSNEDKSSLRKSNPSTDFRDFVVPPRTGKYTFASVIDFVEKGDKIVKKAFVDLMDKNPEFMDAVLGFYPKEKVAAAMATTAELPATGKPVGSLALVTTENTVAAKKLPEEDKKTLFSKGYVILDKRSDKQTSKFGVIQYENKITNPSESGLCSYLTQKGTLRFGLALLKPKNLKQGFSSDHVVIIDLESDNGNAYVRKISEVNVKDQIRAKDFKKVMASLEEPASATPSYKQWYMLVNEQLESVGPFQIGQNYTDASGMRHIVISQYYIQPEAYKKSFNRFFEQHGNLWAKQFKDYFKEKKHTLIFTKKVGNELEHNGEYIYIPKGYKLLPVNTPEYDFGECGCYYPSPYIGGDKEHAKNKEEYHNNAPGSRAALTGSLYSKNIFPMTVHSNGSEYFMTLPGKKKKYASAKDATIGLVFDFGLSEKQASELVGSLVPDIVKKGYCKLAELGDYHPNIPDEAPYSDEFGTPTYTGYPQQQTMNPGDAYTGNPTQKGLGVMPDIQGIEPSSGGNSGDPSQQGGLQDGQGEQDGGQQQQPDQQQGGDPSQGGGQDIQALLQFLQGGGQQQGGDPSQQYPSQQGGQPQGGPSQQGGQAANAEAQNAASIAQGGQKEVFDAQSIATLAKYVNGPEKVVSYVPTFISALDKLGRTLFLLNWETDKFKKAYGDDELPELIEITKNVFNNIGDLVILIRRTNPDVAIQLQSDSK